MVHKRYPSVSRSSRLKRSEHIGSSTIGCDYLILDIHNRFLVGTYAVPLMILDSRDSIQCVMHDPPTIVHKAMPPSPDLVEKKRPQTIQRCGVPDFPLTPADTSLLSDAMAHVVASGLQISIWGGSEMDIVLSTFLNIVPVKMFIVSRFSLIAHSRRIMDVQEGLSVFCGSDFRCTVTISKRTQETKTIKGLTTKGKTKINVIKVNSNKPDQFIRFVIHIELGIERNSTLFMAARGLFLEITGKCYSMKILCRRTSCESDSLNDFVTSVKATVTVNKTWNGRGISDSRLFMTRKWNIFRIRSTSSAIVKIFTGGEHHVKKVVRLHAIYDKEVVYFQNAQVECQGIQENSRHSKRISENIPYRKATCKSGRYRLHSHDV
ncbi:hypothetical protein CVS40_6781 [Lucilia cuprina]|nr:hypothetical protein CVS40_6781 [Lucilia cuprina]